MELVVRIKGAPGPVAKCQSNRYHALAAAWLCGQNNSSFHSNFISGLSSPCTCGDGHKVSEFGATLHFHQEEWELHKPGCCGESAWPRSTCPRGLGDISQRSPRDPGIHPRSLSPNDPHSCLLPARYWGPGALSQVWVSPGCGSQAVPGLAPSPSLPASCGLPGLSREAPPQWPMPALTPELAPTFPRSF